MLAGHGADTFNMGSLRNELNMHTHFPSTGSIEEEEDEDEDIMLMGTTPQVGCPYHAHVHTCDLLACEWHFAGQLHFIRI